MHEDWLFTACNVGRDLSIRYIARSNPISAPVATTRQAILTVKHAWTLKLQVYILYIWFDSLFLMMKRINAGL